MNTREARQVYRKRRQSVERVFGIINYLMGFRQFLLRRLPSVGDE